MRRKVFVSALNVFCVIATGALQAAELTRLQTDRCITNLAGDGNFSRGIATEMPYKKAYVVTCDGLRQQILLSDDGLALGPEEEAEIPPRKAGALPDGEVTAVPGRISAAWLSGPTGRYRHGILGDPTEASGFHITLQNGTTLSHVLPDDSVLEDLRVRLADLTGDGREEFLVIRSYLDRGAALALFGLADSEIVPMAESRPIGSPNRWLNPAGVADFDGDGKSEVALVVTPHVGGLLQLHELTPAGLRLEQEEVGFSNHAIGSRVLDMAAVIDWNGDGTADLALPDADRRHLQIITFAGGRFVLLESLPQPASLTTAILASDLDGDGKAELLFGLEDGGLVLLVP